MASVLNFVFSNREQSSWDNNKGKDFHTAVAGAKSGDELVAELLAGITQVGREFCLLFTSLCRRFMWFGKNGDELWWESC